MTGSTLTPRSAGGISILESEPGVAPELQRQIAGEDIAVRGFRRVADLAEFPEPRVCVLALDSDPDAIAGFLLDVRDQAATACVVVTSTGESTELEWLLREIGAVSVIDRFVSGTELAAICRRLLKSQASNARAHTGASCP